MDLLRRRSLLAAAALVPLAPALAAPAIVDLDSPGALARLRAERPEQFSKVMELLRDAERMPENKVEGWIRTRYDADSVHLGRHAAGLLSAQAPPVVLAGEGFVRRDDRRGLAAGHDRSGPVARP